MFFSTITKTGVGAGIIASTLTLPEIAPASYSTELNRTGLDKKISINSLDDVEILESQKGCTLSFIDSFDNNRAYRAKEFNSIVSKKENPRNVNWKSKIIWATDHYYNDCTPGRLISFAYNHSVDNFFFKEEG